MIHPEVLKEKLAGNSLLVTKLGMMYCFPCATLREREIESKKIMFQDHRVPTDHSKLGFVDLE